MKALLISTYDLGRQPFGLASPAAWLRDVGVDVGCADLAKEPLREDLVREAALIAFHLPMHTATRLAVPAIRRVRACNSAAHVCCYGLYAPLNAEFLRSVGAETILGAEFEGDLVALALSLAGRRQGEGWDAPEPLRGVPAKLPRLKFRVPDRSRLPALTRYAAVITGPDERRVAGYTEASRGCKHLCRHCPIVPLYNGQFRIVRPDVVLADIRAQIEAGARHITFGDPDFFNGIRHAVEVVERLAREFPGVTYDVTIKVEHLLRHAAYLRTLAATGCLFVTSAFESVDDRVLAILEKNHTRADVIKAVELCRDARLTLMPTFVPFTPWISLESYCELLRMIQILGLEDHVAPIQLAIRLLIPEGSRLLALPDVRAIVEPFDPADLAYPWRHADPEVDQLQLDVADLVGMRVNVPRREIFEAVATLAHERAGLSRAGPTAAIRSRTTVPYLNEPWYC